MKTKNIELIKESEGLRLKAYMPTKNDRPTIGYGHTKGVKMGMTITKAQAEQYLRDDLAWAENAVNRLVKVKLNQNQFDALVSFVFNLGEANFASSTLLRKLNTGDYEGAANQFPRWNKQRTKSGSLEVLDGLTIRRDKERKLFLSPVNSKKKDAAIIAIGAAGSAGAIAYPELDKIVVDAILVAILSIVVLYFFTKGKKS